VNTIPDKFAQWDAAYVLGALSPAERREFEEHLATCPHCQAAVSELAGMPGLLAQVSPADAAMLSMAVDNDAGPSETAPATDPEAELIEPGPPSFLLPKMIKKARSRRRRMVAAVAGIAAGWQSLAGCCRCARRAPSASPSRQSYRLGLLPSLMSFLAKRAPK